MTCLLSPAWGMLLLVACFAAAALLAPGPAERPKGAGRPAFAAVSRGNLLLWLSGPGSSGARPLPDGRRQEPGGWNRIVVEVEDLAARVNELKAAGLRFRNEIESGPGGKQIQIEDPDGNPIELFQPAQP